MSPRLPVTALATALVFAFNGTVHAQHDHRQHQATPPPTTQADPHAGHAPPKPSAADASKPSAMDHSTTDHAAMGHAPAAVDVPRTPVPPVTQADRDAAFPALSPHAMEHAPSVHSKVLFNRLEGWEADHGNAQAWEGSAWIGSDLNRLWLRSEGERIDGRTESSDLELLYGRSITPWWDVVVGVKHDFRPADSRSWAAVGVQGMAPYKFEVSATAYLGESGQLAATVEAEYELLLSNRLILQPRMEARFSAKDEPEYGNGAGLNTVEAGLRLRYEFTRRFAPYIGVVHERTFGDTADHRIATGENARDTRVVAGVRFWF